MTKQEQLQRFDDLVAKLRKTLEDKGHDYASEDVLSNFKDSGKRIGKTPEEQCLALISTKVSRLSNLLSNKNKTPKNEAIQDSILDLIGYSFLLDCITTEKPKGIKPSKTWKDVLETTRFDWGFSGWNRTVSMHAPKNFEPFRSKYKSAEQFLIERLEKEIEKLHKPPANTQQNNDDMTKVFEGFSSNLDFSNLIDYDKKVAAKLQEEKSSYITAEQEIALEKELKEITQDLAGEIIVLSIFEPFLDKGTILKSHQDLLINVHRLIQIEEQVGLDTKNSKELLQALKEKTK